METLLSESFKSQIKQQRIDFIKKRLELDPMSLFGILKFINEYGLYCEDELNLLV